MRELHLALKLHLALSLGRHGNVIVVTYHRNVIDIFWD